MITSVIKVMKISNVVSGNRNKPFSLGKIRKNTGYNKPAHIYFQRFCLKTILREFPILKVIL